MCPDIIWQMLLIVGIKEFIRSDRTTLQQMSSDVQGSTWSLEDDSAFDDYVFNWHENRCLLFNHLYPDIGTLLEEEFQSALSLFTGSQVTAELDSDDQLHHVTISN